MVRSHSLLKSRLALTRRLRDQMNLIEESSDMDMLAGSVKDTGGVYFVTAFSGLLAPYWDREAVSYTDLLSLLPYVLQNRLMNREE
jgi:glycerol kinase